MSGKSATPPLGYVQHTGEIPTINTFRLRNYRATTTPAGTTKLASCDNIADKFGPTLPNVLASTARNSSPDAYSYPAQSGAMTVRENVRKRPDVVRDLRTVTPCMKIGDVATLECWLNDMLGRSLSRKQRNDPSKENEGESESHIKIIEASKGGLQDSGLDRETLYKLGVPPKAADRLFRALYVYSVGFLETVNEAFTHSAHRRELLCNIWNGFLLVAEENFKVAYKSEISEIIDSRKKLLNEIESLHSEVEAVNTLRYEVQVTLSGAESKARIIEKDLKKEKDEVGVVKEVLNS